MKIQEPRDQFLADLDDTVERALNPRQLLPGFAPRMPESVNPISMPPWFIDRCRRAYLGALGSQVDGAVLGVTSALPGEGKTSLAIGMATAISADTQKPTLLLECDLERPSFHRYFSFDLKTGLCDWMEGSAPLRILHGGPLVKLFLIPSGPTRAGPSTLFYQLCEGGIVDRLRPHFGTVIIDLPPVLSIAYGSLVSQLSDRIVLVARYGMTSVDDIEKAISLLGRDRVSGIVLNGTEYVTPYLSTSDPVVRERRVRHREDEHRQRGPAADIAPPAPETAESFRDRLYPAQQVVAADEADGSDERRVETQPRQPVRPRAPAASRRFPSA